MTKYRKKPVVIEARQTGSSYGVDMDIKRWCGGQFHDLEDEALFCIETLEGSMAVSPGDWVIKGVHGEFYPCKPDIFAATYDPVGDEIE